MTFPIYPELWFSITTSDPRMHAKLSGVEEPPPEIPGVVVSADRWPDLHDGSYMVRVQDEGRSLPDGWVPASRVISRYYGWEQIILDGRGPSGLRQRDGRLQDILLLVRA